MIRILEYGEVPAEEIFARSVPETDVAGTVRAILEDVQKRGDAALLEYTERFDGVRLAALEVTQEEKATALSEISPRLREVLERSAANIRRFHEAQRRQSFVLTDESGVVMGQRIVPVDRAGLYVPGGTAALASTVLMDVIPAKLAGVPEVVMVTPPGKDGRIASAVLAAAQVAGADRIFKVGGAQAVAALAFGTETIPAVDKIVGPGNAFVAEAKRQVYGKVSIDMIAGPSEILIVSDRRTNPRWIATDLLSQAEHDRMASAVLVTDSGDFALAVQAEIERQLPLLGREEIARASVEKNGKIIVTDSLRKAVDVANALAPEHLELCVDDPFALLGSVRHAGSVFLGRYCPEALGDYLAGPNHTLPTGGTARFSSPLSVDDFVKKMQYTYYTEAALSRDAADVAAFARAEGLEGHARSALARTEGER